MTTAILAELVSNHTDTDPLDLYMESDKLVSCLKQEGVSASEKVIEEVWDEAYGNVVCGNAEYWDEEYGLYGGEVEAVICANFESIIQQVRSLLK